MKLQGAIEETAFNQQSLYFMLIYAWRLWAGGNVAPAGATDLKSPSDLLAKLLIDAVTGALSSGLHRDYISVQEETLLPSGRILLQETINNRSRRRAKLFVQRDTFSSNCLPNIILKEAIKAMLFLPLKNENKETLLDLLGRLSKVDDRIVGQREIKAELYKSRRRDYRVALSIALTIKKSAVVAPSYSSEISVLAPEISDETMLRTLFETFLREFYRYHLSDRFVGGRRYSWSDQSTDIFPIMQTDTNIESEDRILVIDAKCTPKVVSKRGDFSKSTLNSGHLYQMLSYMSHAKAKNSSKSVSGVLIYPRYSLSVDEVTNTPVGPLRVKTIDFHRGWDDISDELLQIAFSG